MKMISSLIYSLFITPFFLAVASAQMTTTAVAGQVTGVSTKLAAGTQASSTAPPTTGTISATLPASASADAAAASAAASISDAAAASAAYAAATSAFATSGNYTDACGPTIPDPTVEDSCDTPVEQVDSPAAYGVQCLNDTQTTAAINITSCSILIPEMCSNQWQRPGEWLWLTANGCSIGSFLPPVSFVGAAPWPSSAQCEELIFASMVDECEYSGLPYNIAAVNLKILPTDQGNVKGAAVNVGYGSYLVSSRQQRTVSDDPDCTYIPPTNYCIGPVGVNGGCYPPTYYQSKYATSSPCGALGSLAPSFTPL